MTPRLKPFDPAKYKKYSEAELRCIQLGTLSLYSAIRAPNPIKASALAINYLRTILHPKPLAGKKIPKGRRSLGTNLRPIDLVRLQGDFDAQDSKV